MIRLDDEAVVYINGVPMLLPVVAVGETDEVTS